MEYMDLSCSDFIRKLSSREPVPGGGSVAALVGALGAALGNMVGALTLGKKKYAAVEDEIQQCMEDVIIMQKELMDLVQKDIDIFELKRRNRKKKHFLKRLWKRHVWYLSRSWQSVAERWNSVKCLQRKETA